MEQKTNPMAIKENFLLLASLLIIGAACNTRVNSDEIKEGVIRYNLEYLNIGDNSFLLSGAYPDDMYVKFKNDNVVFEMSDPTGIYGVKILALSDKNQIAYMLKLLTKKYVAYYNYEEFNKRYSMHNQCKAYSFSNLSETKSIAGLQCKAVLVSDDNNNKELFNIYSSDKILINEFAKYTPYSGVDGVLTEYPVIWEGVEMHIKAVEVMRSKLDDSIFVVPSNYKKVSREYFEDLLGKLR